MYFFVGEIKRSENGQLIEVFYDDILTLHVMNPETKFMETRPVKQTLGPFNLHLFEREPLSNILGVFASGLIAAQISRIITRLVRRQTKKTITPLEDIRFLLHQKEEEIRKIQDFADLSEVKVEGARDLYVDDLWIKGSALYDSEEYQKFIKNPKYAGRIRFFALTFAGRVYYLIEDGRIFTRQAGNKLDDESSYIYSIVKNLYEVGAVRYY